MWVTNLLKVPWLIYENGEKGEIISEAPSEDNLKGITNEKVVNHLQELGYL
jgi:hypothetical protein